MTRFLLYPLAAIGAAAVATIATSVAISREARRLDDADVFIGILAAAAPPAPTDAYVDQTLRDLSAQWDYLARDIEAGR